MSIKAKAKKRIIILLVCLLTAAGGVGALFGYKHHKDQKLLATARSVGLSAVADGNYPVAVSHLAYYLSVYPDDVEVLSAYVQARPLVVADGYAHISDTLRRLQHLLDLDPSRVDARRQLMSLNARFGRMTEAMQAADELLARVPNDPAALQIKVECLERLRHYKEALALATEKWCKVAPNDPQAPLTVLHLMQLSGKQPPEILAWAKANSGPADSLGAKMVTALADDLSNDQKSATDLLQSAASMAKSNPPSPQITKTLVRMLDNQGLYPQSLALLEQISKSQNDPAAKRSLVRRLWEAGRWQSVVDLTQNVGTDLAKDHDKTSKVVSRELAGLLEMSALRCMALTQLNRDQDAQQLRSAMAAVGQGPIETAWVAVLNHQKDSSDNPKALLEICRKAMDAERNNEDAANPYLQYFIAEAYVRLGEAELAISELKEIQNSTWAIPMIKLAELELSRGRAALALQAAEYGERRAPNSPAAVIILARCWAAMLETGEIQTPSDKILDAIVQIRKQLPDNEELIEAQVSIQAKSGHPELAKKTIEEALAAKHPLTEPTLIRLAALSRVYNLDLADKCYARAGQDDGMTPELAYAKAIALFSRGQGNEGLKSLQADRDSHAKGDDLSWILALNRYLDVVHDPSAKAQWMALGDKYPKNLAVQQIVLSSPSVVGERDFLDRTIQRLRALTSDDSLTWRLARARWLLNGAKSDQDLTQASLLLKDILRVANDQAEAHLLLAQCYDRLRDVPSALDELNAASTLDPQSSSIALYRARLLQKQGQFDKARDQLDRLIATGTINDQQQKEIAVLLAQQGDTQRAVDLMQKLGQSQSDSMVMAMLYRRQGQFDKAEQVCRRMLKENPDPIVIQFTADLLASQHRTDEAEKVLGMLDGLSLKPGLKELIIADHYARFVSLDQGEKMFQNATVVAPQEPSTWTSLIRFELASGRAEAAKTAIANAAKALPDDKTIQTIQAATDTLLFAMSQNELKPLIQSAVVHAEPDSPEIQTMRIVQGLRAGTEPAKQLTDRLQKVADANLQNMPIQIVLAREDIKAGRLDEAMAVATRAVQAFPTEPAPAELAVDIYTYTGRWSEMLGYAQLLRDRIGQDKLRADISIALANHEMQRPRQAVDQLAPYIPQLIKTPDANASTIVLYVTDLILVGQDSDAEAILWPLALQNEHWRRNWIDVMAQNSVVTQAAIDLEKVTPLLGAEETQSKMALADAWRTLATRGKNPSYIANGKRILEELVQLPTADATTYTALATFQEDTGDPDSAMENYQHAIAMPKGEKAVSRNNLAMLLAKRGQSDDLKNALVLAQAAVQDSPKMPTLYDTLAFVQLRNKDYESAAKTIQVALNLDKQNPLWWLRLGEIYASSGRRKDAASALNQIDRIASPNLSDENKARILALRNSIAGNGVAQSSAG